MLTSFPLLLNNKGKELQYHQVAVGPQDLLDSRCFA